MDIIEKKNIYIKDRGLEDIDLSKKSIKSIRVINNIIRGNIRRKKNNDIIDMNKKNIFEKKNMI